jgi:DNA recombination protein RmuC
MTIVLVILSIINLVLISFLLLRKQSHNSDVFEKNQERLERIVREDISKIREDQQKTLGAFSESLFSRLTDNTNTSKNQLDTFSKQLTELTQINEQKLENLREAVEGQLTGLREDNTAKLEQMRETVDEKLQSFKIVSDRLEKVHQGLGEMQNLASGVGDLKKVLENVKAKGNLGEFQLAALLEQVLSPEQYVEQLAFGDDQRGGVDFAVKYPGAGDEPLFLPIDSKFPTVDYENLLNAQEAGNKESILSAVKSLEAQVKKEAKSISEKYIIPPKTTDFAILFLPFEGLFAEVLRIPGLFDTIQREYKVTITGPTTIIAFLTSLRMGFRTLTVQKRASEVLQALGEIKPEFGRFGEILEATKRKIDLAGKEIDKAAVRSRSIERKLRDVEELSTSKSAELIETQLGNSND